MRILLTSALIFGAASAQAAPINGDFSNGLSNFTLEACGFTCDRPTGPFFDIKDFGGNPYLEVTTSTSLLGVVQASAKQDIAITQSTSILSFDAVQLETFDDFGSGTAFFDDGISIVITDALDNLFFLFEFQEGGPDINPFNQPQVFAKETAASDAAFDLGVEADLGQFIGQTVSLGIFAFSESDRKILTAGFDNFRLSGELPPISAVPLPSSFPLMIAAVGVVGFMRRRRKT